MVCTAEPCKAYSCFCGSTAYSVIFFRYNSRVPLNNSVTDGLVKLRSNDEATARNVGKNIHLVPCGHLNKHSYILISSPLGQINRLAGIISSL